MWDVRFDAGEGATINGMDSSILDCEFANGSPVGNFLIPTRESYYFVGWFTAPDGGEQVFDSSLVRTDMTLYAHWAEYHAPAFTTGGDANWTEQPDGSWMNISAVNGTSSTSHCSWSAPLFSSGYGRGC